MKKQKNCTFPKVTKTSRLDRIIRIFKMITAAEMESVKPAQKKISMLL